ncbi:hypothetical protein SAQ01S_02680 [Sphingomonas aquatilis NBRC 16722]|uniref:Excisionase family DNA binding protein n=1 Tax=Sphingomonas aquatilis TaxID=93063 RepID=A0AAW3TMR1_9SPHN|nr:helix-turn-helix domain-containing protein [Sphingomonas aquatilis]MBB3874267.1 excisionase family DNA binding protein [Sphingomonas aquatilis]GEM70502.1 hypothetical protein SAQ01S_02680 [Sphingomonas aquatilis NBRC 16722]
MYEELTRPAPLRLAYSVDEAARATGLGRTTLFKLIGDGTLPSVKIGKRRVIRAADLDNLLAIGSAAA